MTSDALNSQWFKWMNFAFLGLFIGMFGIMVQFTGFDHAGEVLFQGGMIVTALAAMMLLWVDCIHPIIRKLTADEVQDS